MTAGDGAPPLLTERDEEIVADCAFAAQIMLAWWAGEPITVNRAEREALARDGNFAEGHEAATWVGLRASTKARYGWSAHLLEGSWAEVMALPADAYCVLFGKYDQLTKHFRRWDTFTGLHAVGYRPSDGWWQDPETLPGAIAGGFSGETIAQPAPAGPALDVAALVAAAAAAAADHEQTIADLTDRLAKIDALARGPNDQP